MLTNPLSGDFAAKQSLLSSGQTLATPIHAILLDKYGEAIYGWEPLTVAMEVKDDFETDMNPTVMDRWCAMQIVMGSNAFFTRIEAFFAVCNSFASGEPFFDEFNPVTLEEMAWTIAEVGMNRDMLPFSYTIRRYIKMMLEKDGYSEGKYPPIFREVFEKDPSSADIRDGLAELHNTTNLNAYIIEQMKDMRAQFNSIPGMKTLDDTILSKGLTQRR